MDFTVIDSKTCFQGKIMDVRKDRIRFDNGVEADREVVVKHHEATAIIALDEQEKLLMVEQYRYGTGQVMLEIPAGLVDPGEDYEVCARRELEEETGYRAGRLVRMFDYYATPGYCSEKIVLYFATDLVKTQQHLDVDEFLSVQRYSLDEAIRKIEQGEITDGKTIAAIFAAQVYCKR